MFSSGTAESESAGKASDGNKRKEKDMMNSRWEVMVVKAGDPTRA